MRKIQKTAKALDVVFNILQIVAMIGFVCCLVGIGIIGLGTLLGLPDSQIGTDFNRFTLQGLTVAFSETAAPSVDSVLLFTALLAAVAAAVVYLARLFIKCIRRVLHTVVDGLPFDSSVADNLKKGSVLIVVIGIGVNLAGLLEHIFTVYVFRLPELLLSDTVIEAAVQFEFSLIFLLYAAVIYLISLVCRYGATLQQQVDETL